MIGTRTSARPTKLAAGLAFGAFLLFGVGTNVGAGWVLAVAALCVALLLLGAVLPFRAARGVDVERRAPDRAGAGEPTTVTLVARARRSRVLGPVLLRDDFLGEASAVTPYLAGDQERTLTGERAGGRRGVHEDGPCEIVTGAPFGVVRVRRTITVPSRTVVHPQVFDLPLEPLLGPAGVSSRAPSGDVASIREYRPRDPLRLVHWRSTARLGELMVREFEDRDRADVVVAADAPTDPDTADAVASAACSFALAALREARWVDLLSPNAPRHRATTPEVVLDWGARLAPGPASLETRLDELPDAGAVVCALEAGQRTAGAVHRLGAIARRGVDVLVILVGGGADEAAFLDGTGARVLHVRDLEEVEACLRAPAVS